MFERFTGSARQAVVVAQREASACGADQIAVEHLLLGLAYPGGGLSEMALEEVGMGFEKLADRLPRPDDPPATPSSPLPFGDETRGILKRSLGVAAELGHNNVGSGHVLAALLERADLLDDDITSDADLTAVAGRVSSMLGSDVDRSEEPDPEQVERRGTGPRVPPPVQQFRRKSDFAQEMGRDTPQTQPSMSRADFDARMRARSPVRQSRVSEVILALVFASTIVSVESVAAGWRTVAFGIGAVAVALFAAAAALRTLDRPRKLKVLTSLRAAGIGLIGVASVLAMIGLAIGR